jgi:hypothetical protein
MREKEIGTRSSGSNGKGKERLGVEDMAGIGVDLGNNGSRNGSIEAVRKRGVGMIFYGCLLLGWMKREMKGKGLSLNGDRSA